jgi:peptide/nickel transport system permease protein
MEGGAALVLWIGLLLLMVARFQRVRGALSGSVGEKAALLVLILVLAAVWGWSWWEARRVELGSEDENEGGLSGAGGWWPAFKENRAALLGLVMVTLLFLMALLAPFLAPFGPQEMPAYQSSGDPGLIFASPSPSTFMGRDQLSRDVYSRLLFGARVSVLVGVLAAGLSVTLGTLVGAVSGFLGGWIDSVVMRFVDMVLAFPRIVLLIAVVAVFEPSVLLIVMTLGLTQWPFAARLVRGEILSLKEREFAEAARALGFSRTRVLFRHLLPNAVAPIIVAVSLGVGNAILLEAGLSFLGLGVPPPQASWGTMISEGMNHLFSAWWISTFPGLVLACSVLAFNLVGDGIRDALDPRHAGKFQP